VPDEYTCVAFPARFAACFTLVSPVHISAGPPFDCDERRRLAGRSPTNWVNKAGVGRLGPDRPRFFSLKRHFNNSAELSDNSSRGRSDLFRAQELAKEPNSNWKIRCEAG